MWNVRSFIYLFILILLKTVYLVLRKLSLFKCSDTSTVVFRVNQLNCYCLAFVFFFFPFSRIIWFQIIKHSTHYFVLIQYPVWCTILILLSVLQILLTWWESYCVSVCLLFQGKYCGLGLQMNHSIESKSNEITVLFMSGIHVSGRGFLASYSLVDKQGNFPVYTDLHFAVCNKWNFLSVY